MPKIKVFITLKNNQNKEVLQEVCSGFINDEKIVYQEDKRIVTILKNSNTIQMIRRENHHIIYLPLEEGKELTGSYQIEPYQPINIVVNTSLLSYSGNKIHICYQTRIENEIMGDFDFNLQYEVIE